MFCTYILNMSTSKSLCTHKIFTLIWNSISLYWRRTHKNQTLSKVWDWGGSIKPETIQMYDSWRCSFCTSLPISMYLWFEESEKLLSGNSHIKPDSLSRKIYALDHRISMLSLTVLVVCREEHLNLKVENLVHKNK